MLTYKTSIIMLILAVCNWLPAFSQYYFYNEDYYQPLFVWETGVSGGVMNCLTDLGGNRGTGRKFVKDINWNATRPAAGLFAGVTYKDVMGARIELAFGQVKAADNVLKNDRSAAYGRYLRNLNFRTNVRELSVAVQLFPLSLVKSNAAQTPLIRPFLLLGIGSFSFSPETFYNNTWIHVAGLHTEGQGFEQYPDRKPYKLTQFNIPLGMGCKYEPSPFLNFYLELTCRKLWTDYLDDVSRNYVDPRLFHQYLSPSQAALAIKLADRRLATDAGFSRIPGQIRGNSGNNDAYFSISGKIAFILGREHR